MGTVSPMAVPRPASTIVLFRRAPVVEVLLGLRPPGGVFGDIWAFPGGAVDPSDGDVERLGFEDSWKAAALRETAEEVGIFLTDPIDAVPTSPECDDVVEAVHLAGARFDPARLRYLSNWVTPEDMPRRFDTRFYLAEVSTHVRAEARTGEFRQLEWVDPSVAVAEWNSGTRPMMMPTIWHLNRVASAPDPWAVPEFTHPMPPNERSAVVDHEL